MKCSFAHIGINSIERLTTFSYDFSKTALNILTGHFALIQNNIEYEQHMKGTFFK